MKWLTELLKIAGAALGILAPVIEGSAQRRSRPDGRDSAPTSFSDVDAEVDKEVETKRRPPVA